MLRTQKGILEARNDKAVQNGDGMVATGVVLEVKHKGADATHLETGGADATYGCTGWAEIT